MEGIRSLEKTSYSVLFEAFREAFIDYELQLNSQELQRMLIRRGFVPGLSFGKFIDGKIVAFTLNGIGSFNGVKTAYDTGTGTVKDYRGQGLASEIFSHSIPFLRDAGVSQYLLEVLQHNEKAVSLYKKLGFTVSREFNYFVQKKENIRLCSEEMHPGYHTEPIELSRIGSTGEFCDYYASWQNSFEAINRKPDDFIILGAFMNDKLIGYCIFDPDTGDITQIAVDRNHRRKGIGTALIKEILKTNRHHSVKIINTEVNCESMNGFLASNSFNLTGKQFEMLKQLQAV